jgi:hypothetical protein
MANNTIVLANGQQLTITTDLSKIFLWNNRYDQADYTAGGADITIPAGTLLGRIGSTGKVVPLTSAAVDGSQFPVGILLQDTFVAATSTVSLTYCVSGDVAANKVIYQGADNGETVVSNRRLKDLIGSDTVGIKLVQSTSNSDLDNV